MTHNDSSEGSSEYFWGQGGWGETTLFNWSETATYETFVHDNTRDVWEAFDNDALDIQQGDPLHTLIHALQTDVDRFDDDLRTQYENLFVETAHGAFLERIGRGFRIQRREGEADQRLRSRIKARISALASDATFEEFASIVLFVLDAAPTQVKLETPSQSGTPMTVIVVTTTDVLDATAFTEAAIVDLLNESVPAGARVQIRTDGTFQYDGPNFAPDANTGFGEGTWGGTYE